MTQQEAYAAGFNQTADLRFVLRDEPAPFTMHTPIGGPPQVRKVGKVNPKRYLNLSPAN